MKRKATILDRVRDVDGGVWDVRDIRTTKYGFDLLFGSPPAEHGVYRGGLPRLIATRPLIDFWDANRLNRGGMLFDLPAGRTTLKRLRRRFGFHYLDDLTDFWYERLQDLAFLTAREFAEKHQVNIDVVFDTRRRLLGNCAREPDWWRKPRPLKILRSGLTLREIGEKLQIGTSQACRLRRRARREK